MIKRIFILLPCLIIALCTSCSSSSPRLVVVIVIDQFSYTYFSRAQEHFGPGGFRYLLTAGANFSNAVYKHAWNLTGPGHAVILTGAYGNQNGIIANHWYDRFARKNIYCVDDRRVALIGNNGPGLSPANLIGSTFGDELRIHSDFRSKVIAVSIKDRSAILLGGKLGSAAYWLEDSLFISSTYYMDSLPFWVKIFNASGLINSYFGRTWDRILPVDAYPLPYSAPSPSGSEIGLGATFPHLIAGTDTSRITASFYEAFRTSPFSNEALAVLAKEAINEEQLGSGPETDVLCISFSSTDYVGHVFGPNSQETLDMIVRTDRILADLFGFIDSRIGLRNCVIVLTSDHGITPVPEFLRTNVRYADAGRLPDNGVMSLCNGVMKRRFGTLKGEKWITRIISNNVYLNTRALEVKGLEVNAVARQLADSLMALEGVAVAIARQDMLEHVPNSPTEQRMRRSFHRTRSGDVVYALKPFYLQNEGPTGTGHGEPYDHDAHVPLIIVGDGIRSGTYAAEASPADIAPTLSLLLGIEFPAGREGRVLTEALKPR